MILIIIILIIIFVTVALCLPLFLPCGAITTSLWQPRNNQHNHYYHNHHHHHCHCRLCHVCLLSPCFWPAIEQDLPSEPGLKCVWLSLNLHVCMCVCLCRCAHICVKSLLWDSADLKHYKLLNPLLISSQKHPLTHPFLVYETQLCRDRRYGVVCLLSLCYFNVLLKKVESSSSCSKKPSHALGAQSAIIKGNTSGD